MNNKNRSKLFRHAFGVILIAILCQSGVSRAQKLYRCGNTFSQVPCEKGSTLPIISQTPVPSTPVLKGTSLCKLVVPQRLSLKDPYSAVVEVNDSPRAAVIQYAGQPMFSREYLVTVNAKNSYGAYVGAKLYYCYLSENETNVLHISETRL